MSEVVILAVYKEAALEKLEKLAKRARKYGQEIKWSYEPRVDVAKRVLWDGRVKEVHVERLVFQIEGDAPRVGDYAFRAQLERVEGGVLVTGDEVGAIGWDWRGECQHCNVSRQRSLGYVVEGPDGVKVVGKTCLRDHLGVDVPAGALGIFAYLKDASGMDDEDGGSWGGYGRWEESTLGVVAAARAAIALWGWVPRSSDSKYASSSLVAMLSRPMLKGEDLKRANELREELKARGDHYEAVAQEVLDWAAALKPDNDYLHNLQVALAGDMVTHKTLGLAVSGAAAFDNQRARETAEEERRKARAEADAKREADGPGEWIGSVKDRVERVLTVERKIGMPDNGFGPAEIIAMVDEAGAKVSWFTGTGPRLPGGKPLEVGDKFKAKFTVKGHAEFRGVRETRVARLAILEVA